MLLAQLLAKIVSLHFIHVVLKVDLLVSCSNQIVLIGLSEFLKEETSPKSQMAEGWKLL